MPKKQKRNTDQNYLQFSGLIAILGLVVTLIGMVLMVILPEVRLAAWMTLFIGVILLAAAFVMDFRSVGKAVTGRRGKFSTGTTVMVSVFIGITLLVNAISIGSYKRYDITALGEFTLTTQTKDVLAELDVPVTATCFFTPGDPDGEYIVDFLGEYENLTGNLSIEQIDPDKNPDIAKEYGTTQIAADYRYPSVVFRSEVDGIQTSKIVTYIEVYIQAESAFTSAILEVTGTKQKNIYFLDGHGEGDITTDYTYLWNGLKENLFNIGSLNLLVTGAIPENCDVLVIMAPTTTMTNEEISIIREYLENNGRLMVLLNPNPPADIVALLAEWGAIIEEGTVIDKGSFVSPDNWNPLVTFERNAFNYPEIQVLGATAIIPAEDVPDNLAMEPMLWTTANSWLERDFDSKIESVLDEGIDRKGSLALAVAIYTVTPGVAQENLTENDLLTGIVVLGDSDFVSDANYNNGYNSSVFLYGVSWLATGSEIINIERKVLPYRQFLVSDAEANFINFSSIGLVPFLVLIMGGVMWWRRR